MTATEQCSVLVTAPPAGNTLEKLAVRQRLQDSRPGYVNAPGRGHTPTAGVCGPFHPACSFDYDYSHEHEHLRLRIKLSQLYFHEL